MARAVWRRSFWNPLTIAKFGAAYVKLHQEPDVAMRSPPLVLGLAMNYTADQLAPFILSLRASGYAGQVVFLAANLDAEAQAFVKAHGVELIGFNPTAHAPYHVINSRWFVYLGYLLARLAAGSFPRSIFLTDVRDVVFQGNPFAPGHADLEAFLENETPRLGECAINSGWMRKSFGEHVLRELASYPISCPGTVIGSGKGILGYIIEMTNTLMSLSDVAASSIADQACHNFVLRCGLIEGLRINANGGRVLTAHHVARDKMQIDQNGVIYGPGGVVSPILHQYDRHPMLKEFIDARYAAEKLA